jgi:hypothetical protein
VVVTAGHDVVRELDPYGSTLNNPKLNAANRKP